ncbi:MAG: diadenylate cyclase CdaA [Alphaproteobacteria bacterium]|nr:diadenylate cyclase CdaA [Alphaproteobacteria bacterium]
MFDWLTAIQFIIISIIVYYFYVTFIKNTSSEKVVRGLLGLAILWCCSFLMRVFHLNILGLFLQWVSLFLSIGLIVVFQPELRKFLILMGNIHNWRNFIKLFKHDKQSNQYIDEVVKAVGYMSKKHIGALIVFAESMDYEPVLERKGIKIEALISSELLLTIFFKNTPLHDGAVIITQNRILYAGAILPLSQNKLNWEYGTRHRAALGMTEHTSSIVLVVSEETGDISVAENGNIKKYNNLKRLREKLEKFM